MGKVSGLEGIVAAETDIGEVDGEKGRLIYRGHWAKELAENHRYEEVAYLLWLGSLPDADQLDELSSAMRNHRRLPRHVAVIIDALPSDMPMMSVLRTAVSALGDDSFDWPPTIGQATALTAIIPTITAYRHHRMNGTSCPEPDDSLDHTSNYLYMLNGRYPTRAQVAGLNAYLVLTMEHGMNASTFAARVVSSTQSDLVSAVSAAIGAMKGPLHGGAPSEVVAMLEAIGVKERAESWLRNELMQGRRLMGFGHRVYKTLDPRAEALRTIVQNMAEEDPWFDLGLHVERIALALLQEFKPGRNLFTNVEFYAAAVLKTINLPAPLFTPTFTIARVVGWTAHVLEQSKNNRIFRPLSLYTGPMPADSNFV
jgi:citrate synthase